MSNLKNGDSIKKIEQRKAKHVSGTTIKTTIEISRKDKSNKMTAFKKNEGNKITKLVTKKQAKLSWI